MEIEWSRLIKGHAFLDINLILKYMLQVLLTSLQLGGFAFLNIEEQTGEQIITVEFNIFEKLNVFHKLMSPSIVKLMTWLIKTKDSFVHTFSLLNHGILRSNSLIQTTTKNWSHTFHIQVNLGSGGWERVNFNQSSIEVIEVNQGHAKTILR